MGHDGSAEASGDQRRVVVLGATGATGRLLTSGAGERGHHVTAFARRPSAVVETADRVVGGSVTDVDRLEEAVSGSDAVLCALGAATPLRRDATLVDGVARLVAAMERHDVRRLVYLSFAGVRASRAQLSWLGRWVIAPVVLHNVVADHEAKEKIIIESDLDWTIVRPPRLSNGPARGYRSGEGIAATGIVPQVTRADVAAFMLDTLTSDSYVHAAPSIVTRDDPGR